MLLYYYLANMLYEHHDDATIDVYVADFNLFSGTVAEVYTVISYELMLYFRVVDTFKHAGSTIIEVEVIKK